MLIWIFQKHRKECKGNGVFNSDNLSGDSIVEKEDHDDDYEEEPPPGQQRMLNKDLCHTLVN